MRPLYTPQLGPLFEPPHRPADLTRGPSDMLSCRWDAHPGDPGLLTGESASDSWQMVHNLEMSAALEIGAPGVPFEGVAAYLGIRAEQQSTSHGIIVNRREAQFPHATDGIARIDAWRAASGQFLANIRPFAGGEFSAEYSVRQTAANGEYLWATDGYDGMHDGLTHVLASLTLTEEIAERHQKVCKDAVRTAKSRDDFANIADALDRNVDDLWIEKVGKCIKNEDRSHPINAIENRMVRTYWCDIANRIGKLLDCTDAGENFRLAMGVRNQARWLVENAPPAAT